MERASERASYTRTSSELVQQLQGKCSRTLVLGTLTACACLPACLVCVVDAVSVPSLAVHVVRQRDGQTDAHAETNAWWHEQRFTWHRQPHWCRLRHVVKRIVIRIVQQGPQQLLGLRYISRCRGRVSRSVLRRLSMGSHSDAGMGIGSGSIAVGGAGRSMAGGGSGGLHMHSGAGGRSSVAVPTHAMTP